MATRICFGIPHRVGACACEVGKDREDLGVVDANELTQVWTNIVGNSPRQPGHRIYSISHTDKVTDDGKNDGANLLAGAISCWTGYNALTEEDPKLIIKTKGDVINGTASFPKIQITLRPLKTVLDYSYTGHANASGEGEIGYESQDATQDVLSIKYFAGNEIIPNYYTDGGQAQQVAVNQNYDQFNAVLAETGKTVTLNQTHYFKFEDRPSEEVTPWMPLDGTEIDPTFVPRVPSMEDYDFRRDESYDFRYRFPSDYFQKYGALVMSGGKALAYPAIINPQTGVEEFPAIEQGVWSWGNYQPDPANPNPLNPEFEIGNYLWIEEGIAPVIKGWYWDSSTPPTGQNGYYSIVQATAFKMVKRIRKRYPFSFLAKETRYESIRALDHTEGNQVVGETGGGGYLYRDAMVYTGFLPQTDNSFEAIAWWRLEINAKLCGWNSIKEIITDPITGQPKIVIKGIKIKGYISLGMKALDASTSQQGNYSAIYHATTVFDNTVDLSGVTTSFVYRCEREIIGYDEYYQPIYEITEYDAGTIPFEVTLTEDNAKDKAVGFLDFPLTSGAELPGHPPGGDGSVPENSIVFIKDFVVTEVILP